MAMTTYPNQSIITTKKKDTPSKGYTGSRKYTMTFNDNFWDAYKNLSRGGFALWRYCCENMEGYKFALSRKDVCEKTGISEDSYKKGRKELIEKGYLVEETNNHFLFYEVPSDEWECDML